MEVLPLKHDVGNDCKYCKGDAFLNNFQLNKREWAAIADEAKTVSRHLTAIF